MLHHCRNIYSFVPYHPVSVPVFENDICGTRPALQPQSRIFNGRDALPGAWPWLGRVSVQDPEQTLCTAILINNQFAASVEGCE